MIEILNKARCSGCKSCANACPVSAISFLEDEEGTWYPHIDAETCIRCNLCEKACPYMDPHHGVPDRNRHSKAAFFAAQLRNIGELTLVSSGGAFQAFANAVIDRGGVVYGAAQENVDHIYHIRVDNREKLKETRRSKYFQSDIGNCYVQAKRDLLDGKTVLFSGTGCQIAGLNCYLGEPFENLFTCEVVCHGVPAKRIWQCYRKEKEQQAEKQISDLIFRDKSRGWSQNQYRIIYADGSEELERSTAQLFHAGYLRGLFYRPSCGSCPFASMPRTADVTLADYWKYKGALNSQDVGVSLVAVNNPHGYELLKMADRYLNTEETPTANALESCRHMDEHPTENPKRSAFIEQTLSEGYFAAARKNIVIHSESFLQRVKRKAKSFLERSIT